VGGTDNSHGEEEKAYVILVEKLNLWENISE
jgi:hypothetical protein